MTPVPSPLRVVEETPAYWRVVFDYPPFNVVDDTMYEGLQNLLGRVDASQNLCVIVFESAMKDFYLSHFDLTGKLGNITTAVGASGFPIRMDTFVRLTRSRVASIAKSRGCARRKRVNSCSLATCDLRHARTCASGNPRSRSVCTPVVVVRSACHIWWDEGARWRSCSVGTTSTAIPPEAIWVRQPCASRSRTPRRVCRRALARRIASFDRRGHCSGKESSSTKSRCHPPTNSSARSTPFRRR